MIKINVFISNKTWKNYIKKSNIYLNQKLKKLENNEKLFEKKNINFSLMLSGNKEITLLNKKFRKKNKSTDVLSFPFYKKEKLVKVLKKKQTDIYLGDIMINHNFLDKKNSRLFKAHFDKLLIHGFLHLMGHKHRSFKDFKKMRKKENHYFKILN